LAKVHVTREKDSPMIDMNVGCQRWPRFWMWHYICTSW